MKLKLKQIKDRIHIQYKFVELIHCCDLARREFQIPDWGDTPTWVRPIVGFKFCPYCSVKIERRIEKYTKEYGEKGYRLIKVD